MDGYLVFFIMTFIVALASILVYPLLVHFMFIDQPDLLWIKKANDSTPKRFTKRKMIAVIAVICIIIAIILTWLMNYSDYGNTAFLIVKILYLCTVPTTAVLLYLKNRNRLIAEFRDNISASNMISAGRFSLIVFGSFLPVLVTYFYYDNDNFDIEDIHILRLLLLTCVVPIVSTLTYKRNLNKVFKKELSDKKKDTITTLASFCFTVYSSWLIVLLLWGILFYALMIGTIMSV